MSNHHCVYVIQLGNQPEVVYVGSTGNSPEERLEVHKAGRKGSRVCRRYVTRGQQLVLRPDLLPPDHNQLTFEGAQRLESQLATELQRRGFTVYGGH